MKRVVILLFAPLFLAGCQWFGNPNPFVGTWIGHGELTEQDTPTAGQTRVTTIDDVIEFTEGMTFTLHQGYRQTVDSVLAASAFQVGTGTYSYDESSLIMTFDATSDASLSDGTMPYELSQDRKTLTIEPATLTFSLTFERAE